MEALQSSSFIKRDPIICCCGWTGEIHCKIVVTNRALRCETHKLALFWWVASEDRLTGVSLWQLSCDPDGRVALRFRQYKLSLHF